MTLGGPFLWNEVKINERIVMPGYLLLQPANSDFELGFYFSSTFFSQSIIKFFSLRRSFIIKKCDIINRTTALSNVFFF